MAFVSAAPPSLPTSSSRRNLCTSKPRGPVHMTASSSSSQTPHPSAPSYPPSSSPVPSAPLPPPARASPALRPRTRAPVVDSRVASVVEAHHWIVVRSDSRRLFERAAVAQADITRQVERRAGQGALHRWVLRQVADPTIGFLDLSMDGKDARYVVMETFTKSLTREAPAVVHRWLSAVERVGPLVGSLDIRTRNYENVFTSKLHDVQFDPNQNVVVIESVNVDKSRKQNIEDVVDVLRSTAEAAVAAGNCIEFCVLHAPGEKGFFKTIEVYKDIDALRLHVETLDKVYVRRVQGRTIWGSRSRQTFRPVVYS